ncbi:MAG: hypothetical protein J6C40_03175, partial [Lentisphaeria bacterium]|nr:hypothetical protein [Lentisphaeria bacterium]
PGGGFATIKIELQEKWDELMKKAGYQPLKNFFLKSDLLPDREAQQFKNYRRRPPIRINEIKAEQ